MTSHSPQACCFSGFRHEGTPKGHFETIANVRAYIASPKDQKPTHAVLLLSDVFGIYVNSQLLADDFAASGYLVVLPDLLDGDAMDIGAFEAGQIDIPAWLSKHGSDTVDPIIDRIINHIRTYLSISKIGGAGYCFGGKGRELSAFYVIRFLKASKLDAGYTAHPSFVTDEELERIGKPLSISAAEIDSIFTTELRHRSERILAETSQRWQINLFSGVTHGFAIRADLKVPQNKFAKEQAFLQSLGWFSSTLGQPDV
ncbi:hypothetical protein PV08_03706 [Exophiala spinifera]|uniref:Dienelactone hydrolase domain-containing protein n=1 Tax=Exophiala spinifera TaxID=91928 RepID=A0A0D1YVV9_9EURO|nr:uncharacterized protein PV08_03706 [Exophiala spinifera]KIW19411.1 hypothetical protein PV08_03706 [Exophiala spinifera]